MDADGNKPIITASTLEETKKALDEFYGVPQDTKVKSLGLTRYESKYPDEYVGYFTYEWIMSINKKEITQSDQLKVYCIDYYPHTIYETNY